MRSKYVASLHILELVLAISILQTLVRPFFSKFIDTLYIFSPYAPNAAHFKNCGWSNYDCFNSQCKIVIVFVIRERKENCSIRIAPLSI